MQTSAGLGVTTPDAGGRRGRAIARAFVSACVLLALSSLAAHAGAADSDPDAFWEFYESNPRLQDTFPFGLYGAGPFPRNAMWQDCSRRTANEMLYDTLSEYSINFLWKAWGWDDEFGPWVYGEELPNQGIRAALGVEHWVGGRKRGLFAQYADRKELLTAAELLVYEKEFGLDRLRFLNDLGTRFPETVVGFVIGDEPHVVPPIVAAARAIEKHTRLPALVVENGPGTVMRFAPHLPCMAADWYRVSQYLRNPWSVARDLREFYAKSAKTVLWLMPMTMAYRDTFDTTKPGLPDSQMTREELRLHFWSAVALGVKGFAPYKMLSRPFGIRNTKSMLDPLCRPEAPFRLLEEMRDLGRDATTIGPLLIPCRPEPSAAVRVESDTVRFPCFDGPAIDFGLLKDIKHDRYFLIPWNNDVVESQAGRVVLPGELLAGRTVYDMHRLEAIELDGGALSVGLAPGAGRIFLLAAAEEFRAARTTVLRHRAGRERIAAWKRLRIARAQRVDMGPADELMRRAAEAGTAGDWLQAAALYCRVPIEIDRAEDNPTPLGKAEFTDIKSVRAALERVAERLASTNMLLNTHHRPLGIDLLTRLAWTEFYENPYVGEALREWFGLVRRYYRAQERFRTGAFWDLPMNQHAQFGFLNEVRNLERQARRNQEAVERGIAERLSVLRKDIRVALLTPNRTDAVFAQLYSFAYENTHVQWFVPDGGSGLRDRDGLPLKPDEFDVVWFHQARFSHAVAQGDTIDPAAVLMPELVAPALRVSMSRYVSEQGHGLLLTGIAGLYTLLLGIETALPDRVLEDHPILGALSFELLPAPGYAEHPVYAGFSAADLPANATYGWIPQSLVSECAWEATQPSGAVLARQMDNGLDAEGRREFTGFDVESARFRGDQYAPVVEYHPGRGKVLVLGGVSVHMMPAWGRTAKARAPELRRRIRMFTLNSLAYLASPTRYRPGVQAGHGR